MVTEQAKGVEDERLGDTLKSMGDSTKNGVMLDAKPYSGVRLNAHIADILASLPLERVKAREL